MEFRFNPFGNSEKKKQDEAAAAKERLNQQNAVRLANEQKERKELAVLFEKYCSTWQSGFYTKADGVNWQFSPSTLQNKYPYTQREDFANTGKIENFIERNTRLETEYVSIKSWAISQIPLDEKTTVTALNEKILGVDGDNAGRAFHQTEFFWKTGDIGDNPVSLLKNFSSPEFPINNQIPFQESLGEAKFQPKEPDPKEIALFIKIIDATAKGEKLWICYDDERLTFDPIILDSGFNRSEDEEMKKKVQDGKVTDLAYWEFLENLYNMLPPSLPISLAIEMDGSSFKNTPKQSVIFSGKERLIDLRPDGNKSKIIPIPGYTPIYTSQLAQPTEQDIQRFESLRKK